MQEIADSFKLVLSSQGFLHLMSSIIVIGILIGFKLNESYIGFKRSLMIIIPFTLVLLVTNALRIQEYSMTKPLSALAFNGSVTTIISSVCYVLGLFLGHVTFHKSKRDAMKIVNNISKE